MYETDRKKNRSEPALWELVESALNFVQTKSKEENAPGFLLFVEGGKIDLAHHKNWAVRAMEEMSSFDKAISKALTMVNLEDTLVVVTADHSHGMTINGYQKRGNPIHGLSEEKDSFGVNHSTIMYATGPGYQPIRRNVSEKELLAEDYKYYAGVYKHDVSVHTGEDIALYATGPSSHLFTGSYDQAMIAHLVSYASCIGPHADLCQEKEENITKNSAINSTASFLSLVTGLVISFFAKW